MVNPEFSGTPIYVRYKDHVLYKNLEHPIADAVERETVGWLTKETEEIILVENDRTVPCLQIPVGQGSGVIILKSCIITLYTLPLQESLRWHLNSHKTKTTAEYALQSKERKTHKKIKGDELN